MRLQPLPHLSYLLAGLFCLLTGKVYAQPPVYAGFEVQQPAEPQGGLETLNQFVAVNLRKPFLARVANAKGIVVVRGVIGVDGQVTDVSVLKQLRPDCDREAVRVFSLFNAWKTAQKDGRAVRQVVTFPVVFRPNEPVQYHNGLVTQYYDANLNAVVATDTAAVVRTEVPTDISGLPTGDLTLFRREENKWKQESVIPLRREPYQQGGTLLIHRLPNLSGFGPVYQLNKDGVILAEYVQGPIGEVGNRLDRNASGLVIKRTELVGGRSIVTSWYTNGQQKSIQAPGIPNDKLSNAIPEQMLAYWDSTGVALVSEGNGSLSRTYTVESLANPQRTTTLTVQGNYQNGLKQGRWTDDYADRSYWAEELYEKGQLQHERFTYVGQPDTLQQTLTERLPTFVTGLPGLMRFITRHIRHPNAARQARATGRVLVRFIVNTDGKLSDITVVQGIDPAANAEALRVVKLMNGPWPNRWNPATWKGFPVKAAYTLPVDFGPK